MKRKRFFTFFGAITAFVGAMFVFKLYYSPYADALLSVLTPVGLIITVAFALYGDSLREWFRPIEIKIECLKSDESNRHLETEDIENTAHSFYSHHLRVVNLTPNKTIENCRVWLQSISVLHPSRPEQPVYPIVFAVPQLMEWASSEYSRDKRTFGKDQILDLGKTWKERNIFMFTIDRSQVAARGLLEKNKGQFGPGATLECAVYTTADNYHAQKEFRFRILVRSIKELPGVDRLIEASLVTAADQ